MRNDKEYFVIFEFGYNEQTSGYFTINISWKLNESKCSFEADLLASGWILFIFNGSGFSLLAVIINFKGRKI